MSRRHLTQKQHAFLKYLRDHVDRHKVWPTYREIADHFEYRSPNSVTQNLQALSRKGFLQRGRNGYALVEQAARDGSIRVRGALRGGQIEPSPSDRLSLTTLFPDLSGLHALELDETADRTAEFEEARYVFMAEGDAAPGDRVVVIDDGRLTVRTVDHEGRPEMCPDAEVLGRYAGHAGPYGIVRPMEAAATA